MRTQRPRSPLPRFSTSAAGTAPEPNSSRQSVPLKSNRVVEEALRGRPLIVFDVSKKEAGDPTKNYKRLSGALKEQGLQCRTNEEALNLSWLQDVSVLVLAHPTQPFTAEELEALKVYFESGGSVLVLLGEGGESRTGTNINYFLEEYGMTVCADAVVRMSVASPAYLHPKEVLINDGMLCKNALQKLIDEQSTTQSRTEQTEKNARLGSLSESTPRNPACDGGSKDIADLIFNNNTHPFVFPYGASVSVQKPAYAFLSSGITAHPSRRPLGAAYTHSAGGRLAALGSYRMFDDDFLEKEHNLHLQKLLFQWFLEARENGDDQLRLSTADEAALEPSRPVPDTATLAERPLPCFQESDGDLPSDFRELFHGKPFHMDLTHLPEVKQIYKQLGVKYEPLSVVPPKFLSPLPPLRPAVYPPLMKDLPALPLELFDLDAEVESPRTRLVRLANQCTDDADLGTHIQRAAEIVSIPLLPGEQEPGEGEERSSKNILCSLIYQICQLKLPQRETTLPSN
ncbi:intraflagellar transport 52 (protein ngd5) family protein [Cystoisospora suis]|uniref:Intraflagellar transport 52 (Protein ngd5) family protein n=1 Tax=Cystoisospora suis TaxID=483139 RepID=A0A2C6KGN6_9APIC|nr:intraflagellar transport 52 (protein ngd5) family protein [Cystoisospora suis]